MNPFIMLEIKKVQTIFLTWNTNSSEGLVYSGERDLAVLKIKPMLVSANTSTLHLADLLENSFFIICAGKKEVEVYPFIRSLDVHSPIGSEKMLFWKSVSNKYNKNYCMRHYHSSCFFFF